MIFAVQHLKEKEKEPKTKKRNKVGPLVHDNLKKK